MLTGGIEGRLLLFTLWHSRKPSPHRVRQSLSKRLDHPGRLRKLANPRCVCNDRLSDGFPDGTQARNPRGLIDACIANVRGRPTEARFFRPPVGRPGSLAMQTSIVMSRYGTIKHEEPDEVMGKKQLQHEGPDDRR